MEVAICLAVVGEVGQTVEAGLDQAQDVLLGEELVASHSLGDQFGEGRIDVLEEEGRAVDDADGVEEGSFAEFEEALVLDFRG